MAVTEIPMDNYKKKIFFSILLTNINSQSRRGIKRMLKDLWLK